MKRRISYSILKGSTQYQSTIKELNITDPYQKIDAYFKMIVGNLRDTKYDGYITWKWMSFTHRVGQSNWNPYFALAWDSCLNAFKRSIKERKLVKKKDPILKTYIKPITTTSQYVEEIMLLISIWCYEVDLSTSNEVHNTELDNQ